MNSERIPFLLRRMRDAAADAVRMTQGKARADFTADLVLNRAVGMSLLMASEIAAQILKTYPDFAAEHGEFPWSAMRGMRNRIAHGYFDIDLERVWDTARNDAPDLVARLDAILDTHIQGE